VGPPLNFGGIVTCLDLASSGMQGSPPGDNMRLIRKLLVYRRAPFTVICN